MTKANLVATLYLALMCMASCSHCADIAVFLAVVLSAVMELAVSGGA